MGRPSLLGRRRYFMRGFGGGVRFGIGTLPAVHDAAHMVCAGWRRRVDRPNAQSKVGNLPLA